MRKLISTLLVLCLLMGTAAMAAAQETVELTFWHQYTDNTVMDDVCAAFNESHPGIKVNPVAFKTQDINKTLRMALTSGTGPDLFYYDSGPGYLGAMASAGLLMDLTEAAQQYGWYDELADWALNSATWKGTLYGIANEYEMLCVFYNKAIFQQLGVDAPATYDQFLDICQKAKDAGIVAVVLDDMEKWPGYHYESLYFGAFGGNQLIRDIMDQNLDGGWNQPVLAEALNALTDLVKAGYTSEFPNGIAHDDALRDFYSGGGAMYLTGTWQVTSLWENMGENVGLFVFPSAKEGVETLPPVGVGSAMQVNATTKHPEETLIFLDYLFDAQTGAKMWMVGADCITPAQIDTGDLTFNPLFLEVMEIANTTDVFNYNIDVLMPAGVNDVTGNYIQQILDGYITGEQAVAQKQEAFAQAIADGLY